MTRAVRYLKGAGTARHLPIRGMTPREALALTLHNIAFEPDPQRDLGTFSSPAYDRDAEDLIRIGNTFTVEHARSYPHIASIESACVSMLGELAGIEAPDAPKGVPCPDLGEAALIAGLAMKFKWRARQLSVSEVRPNLILSQHSHVSWLSFCRFCDVEPRIIPIARSGVGLCEETLSRFVDPHTIGVVGSLGTHMAGRCDAITEIASSLRQVSSRNGIDCPLHVDATVGGLPTALLDPSRIWDFRLEEVHSISMSSSSYGVVAPEVVWVLWRGEGHYATDLQFMKSHLPHPAPMYGLSTSYQGGVMLAHYYTYLQLGRSGLRELLARLALFKTRISQMLRDTGEFEILSDESCLPVIVFCVKAGSNLSTAEISQELRRRGWIVPSYFIPFGEERLPALRIVIKRTFSELLEHQLTVAMRESITHLHTNRRGSSA